MTTHPPLDTGIPVLTEIIPSPSPALLEEASTAALASRQKEEVVTLQMRAVSEWDEDQWNRIEHEIRERVLYQVLERIDFVLEQRVRDSLAAVLQTAVERLASEIKDGLHGTLKEVVTRAVAQEITKLQAAKK